MADIKPVVEAVERYGSESWEEGASSRDAEVAALEQRVKELEDQLKPEPPVLPPLLGQSLETIPPNVKTVPAIRAYFQPDDFLPGKAQILWTSTNDSTVKVLQKGVSLGATRFWISFKTGPETGAAAMIDKFLASIPKDKGYTVYVTYFHEHNGDIRKGSLSLAKYKEGSKIVGDLAHKNGWKFGPCHNGSVLRPDKPGWGYHPEVWAAMEGDVSQYDFWGLDGYAPNYEDPAVLFKPAADYAKSLGLPLCWGETASPVGPKQAAWATKARAWMLANCETALWWSHQKAGKPNYRLTEASAKAWYAL